MKFIINFNFKLFLFLNIFILNNLFATCPPIPNKCNLEDLYSLLKNNNLFKESAKYSIPTSESTFNNKNDYCNYINNQDDTYQNTALMSATATSKTKIVTALINCNANPNLKNHKNIQL